MQKFPLLQISKAALIGYGVSIGLGFLVSIIISLSGPPSTATLVAGIGIANALSIIFAGYLAGKFAGPGPNLLLVGSVTGIFITVIAYLRLFATLGHLVAGAPILIIGFLVSAFLGASGAYITKNKNTGR